MLVFISKGIDKERAKMSACESYKNITGKYLTINYDELGKPIANDCYVSISHTQDVFLMAVSRCNVGIDIERRDRKISSKIGTIESWTEMEAYCKFLGTGIKRELIGKPIDQSMIHKVDISDEYIISVYSSDDNIMICTIFG